MWKETEILNRFVFIETDREEIDISGSKDVMVVRAPNAEILWCEGCSNLVRLESMDNVKELWCGYNPSLMELPNLPNCKVLNCEGAALRKAPFCPRLERGHFSNCLCLREIPAYASCRHLNAWGCCSLVEVGELPSCETLDCACCPNLLRVGKLRSGCRVWCAGNLSLSALPPETQDIDVRTLAGSACVLDMD